MRLDGPKIRKYKGSDNLWNIDEHLKHSTMDWGEKKTILFKGPFKKIIG